MTRTSSKPDPGPPPGGLPPGGRPGWLRSLLRLVAGFLVYAALTVALLWAPNPGAFVFPADLMAPVTFLAITVLVIPMNDVPSYASGGAILAALVAGLVLLWLATRVHRLGWAVAALAFVVPGAMGAWIFFAGYD